MMRVTVLRSLQTHMISRLSLKTWASKLKRQTLTIYFVARDSRTPALARLLAVLVAAYALSPIDLIPDFIPVIGYLDDLILIPLGIALVVRLTPADVIEAAREKAAHVINKPVNYGAAAVFVGVWLILVVMFTRWVIRIAVKD
jgi:uncharacterized membrane protein YkvA (DUF1232 family)